MNPIHSRKICVYCASSNKTPDIYKEAARELGALLARNAYTIVYGGGARGLMGQLADSALSQGGNVIGIIPDFMMEMEWGHAGVTELRIVKSMGERKQGMIEDTHAIIALPGGTGTLEELMEAITQKRLGFYNKPIIIVNTNGFYDHLMSFFQHCENNGFLHSRHKAIWQIVSGPEEILHILNNPPEWSDSAIHFAVV
jgi:uncharacterized protein (TIGR00730 family)